MKNDGVDLSTIKAGNDNLFQSEIFSNTIATLVNTEINIIDTTGAVGAGRAAGVSKGDFDSLRAIFSVDEQVMTYSPLKERQAFIDAYNLWKNDLENNYNN